MNPSTGTGEEGKTNRQTDEPSPWQGERCRNCWAVPTLPTYKLSAFTWGRQKKTRRNQCMVAIVLTNHISFRKITRNTAQYCHQILNLTNIITNIRSFIAIKHVSF
jgi:hypothetical protein